MRTKETEFFEFVHGGVLHVIAGLRGGEGTEQTWDAYFHAVAAALTACALPAALVLTDFAFSVARAALLRIPRTLRRGEGGEVADGGVEFHQQIGIAVPHE